ncbi:MAG: hypothetical protein Kow0020_01440 [Wenzhouxiangellaceae bacterium]
MLAGSVLLVLYFVRPLESLIGAAWLLGFYWLLWALVLLILSWRLRGIHRSACTSDRT